ncbi:MAG: CaiB/BaiF CoA transferase family protein [Myxococcota bacterium]
MSTQQRRGRPLEGLRVVDFSRLLPGPYASLVLADLGAEVIKVEPPRGGDYLRWLPPLAGEVSHAFAALNTGKRSVAIDLKHPDGVDVARRLVASADVLLESFRPGVMDRLGLGWETLRAEQPGLVYCAVSGYGQDGPYRDRAGHDLNYVGLAGVLGLAGPADRPPAVPPVQVADIGGGALWSLVGILSALYHQQRTGEGAWVDVSMTEGSLSFLQAALAPHLAGGEPPPERGGDTLTGGQACYGVYETKDGGFMTLAALEPKFWQAFCRAVERPDLLSRQYGEGEQVEDNRREIAALFASRTRAEWETLLAGVDACCEPVLAPDEVAGHPLHAARRNVVEDSEGTRRLRTPLQSPEGPAPEAAPALGADTRSVLEDLGLDAARVDALIEAGAVKT